MLGKIKPDLQQNLFKTRLTAIEPTISHLKRNHA